MLYTYKHSYISAALLAALPTDVVEILDQCAARIELEADELEAEELDELDEEENSVEVHFSVERISCDALEDPTDRYRADHLEELAGLVRAAVGALSDRDPLSLETYRLEGDPTGAVIVDADITVGGPTVRARYESRWDTVNIIASCFGGALVEIEVREASAYEEAPLIHVLMSAAELY